MSRPTRPRSPRSARFAGVGRCAVTITLGAAPAVGLLACGGGSDDPPPLVQNPAGTTLERSIGVVAPAGEYARLEYQEPWTLVTREDLAAAQAGRSARRGSLLAFVQLTDMHVSDALSAVRVPYVRRFGPDFKTAYRNQEALTLQVAESMVRQANELTGGPATGAPASFVIHTGDNGDDRQTNELRNYIDVLDGAVVHVDSSGEGYVGVQDDYHVDGDPTVYDQYWHPDPPPAGVEPDQWKRAMGFPEYPDLLAAASADFQATGLDLPWYSAHGNHDSTVFGNFTTYGFGLDGYWNPLATGTIPDAGSQMLTDLPPGMSLDDFLACITAPTPECATEIFTTAPMRAIPANLERELYSVTSFLEAHFASPATPGPLGHGFTSQNLADGTLYYAFDAAPGVVGIMLDTVDPSGGADGSIGSVQAAWLEAQLQANSSRWLEADGSVVDGTAEDRLVVMFSHHNLTTMSNATALPEDPDPVKLLGPDIEALLLRYPNVVLWVNGHSHFNRVWCHPAPDGAALGGGFWEVNTASHIDYPQQSRTIELVDNQDGTLSVFAILFDHLAPPGTDPAQLDVLGLASISRELSANDPDFDLATQIGAPTDRNVELLIDRPF